MNTFSNILMDKDEPYGFFVCKLKKTGNIHTGEIPISWKGRTMTIHEAVATIKGGSPLTIWEKYHLVVAENPQSQIVWGTPCFYIASRYPPSAHAKHNFTIELIKKRGRTPLFPFTCKPPTMKGESEEESEEEED